MIRENEIFCPKCGGILFYYDTVRRSVIGKYGNKRKIYIRRVRCKQCHTLHRELPEDILPYKQYESDIIYGVLYGFITCNTFGFYDYPCEMTMSRWKKNPPRLFLQQVVNNLE